MEAYVYILCAITSFVCAVLLYRGHRQRPSQLLLWGSVCFAGLTFNNVLLFVDLILMGPEISLAVWRNAVGLASLSLFLWGLIWEVV